MANAAHNKALRSALVALVVAGVLVALLAVTSLVVVPKNNSAEAGEVQPNASAFAAEPRDSVDALFVGDSEVFSSFRPNLMFDEQGFTSYDCSVPAQRLYYSKYLIEKAFETQSPRIVVLETDSFFLFFSFGEAFEAEVERIFPVFRYHDRWKSLTADDFVFTKEPEATWYNLDHGFRPEDGVKAADSSEYMDKADSLQTIPPINQYYLDSIIDFVREQGAIPVVVSVPSTVNWDMGRHNFIDRWSAERGVDYYDLNMDPYKVDIDWNTETRDGGDHLNMAGSKKVSVYVAKLLAERYELPDHRDDPAYSHWYLDTGVR